jgi:hypothetical protein
MINFPKIRAGPRTLNDLWRQRIHAWKLTVLNTKTEVKGFTVERKQYSNLLANEGATSANCQPAPRLQTIPTYASRDDAIDI